MERVIDQKELQIHEIKNDIENLIKKLNRPSEIVVKNEMNKSVTV